MLLGITQEIRESSSRKRVPRAGPAGPGPAPAPGPRRRTPRSSLIDLARVPGPVPVSYGIDIPPGPIGGPEAISCIAAGASARPGARPAGRRSDSVRVGGHGPPPAWGRGRGPGPTTSLALNTHSALSARLRPVWHSTARPRACQWQVDGPALLIAALSRATGSHGAGARPRNLNAAAARAARALGQSR